MLKIENIDTNIGSEGSSPILETKEESSYPEDSLSDSCCKSQIP